MPLGKKELAKQIIPYAARGRQAKRLEVKVRSCVDNLGPGPCSDEKIYLYVRMPSMVIRQSSKPPVRVVSWRGLDLPGRTHQAFGTLLFQMGYFIAVVGPINRLRTALCSFSFATSKTFPKGQDHLKTCASITA